MPRAIDRPVLSAVALVLADGVPVDARSVVHVDAEPDRAGRRLVVGVEPTEPGAHGREVAARALTALRDAFAAAADVPAEPALRHAFAAANDAAFAANRNGTGGRWERRVGVGAVAMAIQGDAVWIAQVPPSQAVVVQDGEPYASPPFATWWGDDGANGDGPGEPEPHPLGLREAIRPAMSRSVVGVGDLLFVCSTNLARGLAEPGGEGIAPFLIDVDTGLDRLATAVADLELDNAHAVGVALGGSSVAVATRPGPGVVGPDLQRDRPVDPRVIVGRGVAWGQRALAVAGARTGTLRTRHLAHLGSQDPRWAEGVPVSDASDEVGDDWGDGDGAALAGSDSDATIAYEPDSPDPQRATATTHGPVPTDGVAGERRRRGARAPRRARSGPATLIERIATRRRRADVSLAARPRALVAPGAGSVRYYRERRSLPIEWRSRLPRGAGVHLPGRVLVALLVVLIGLGTAGAVVGRSRERADQARGNLAAVDAHLAMVDAQLVDTRGADAIAVDAQLDAARDALEEADDQGAAEEALVSRRHAVAVTEDRAHGAVRFADVVRVGSLPAALVGGPARLVRVGSEIYLVAGAFYRVDVDGRQLVRLLAPGDLVAGAAVGELREAAGDGGGVVVSDGAALYAADGGGWSRRPLGAGDEGSAWATGACAAFQGSFYALDAEAGLVLKFAAGSPDALPEDWAGVEDREALRGARDLVIDGRVHVLLADGRVRSFLHGAPRGDPALGLVPPVVNPVAMDGGPDANFLYLAEPALATDPERAPAGRIVRVDPNGGRARQYLAPMDADADAVRALGEARDLVVDEANGAVYVLTGDAIWRATLPAPGTAV